MKYAIWTTAAVAALALSACVEQGSYKEAGAMRTASSNAETACMSAVDNNYGGKVKTITVTGSEFSQANSVVMPSAGGERWRCLVSDDGKVQDLSVQ